MQITQMIGTDIDIAAAQLRAGHLVGIPTETVYGLAANGFDEKAVLKIFEAKNRPHFNPLILHAPSLERFESYGLHFPEKAKLLASTFSPGPLTFVIQKSSMIPDIITAGTDAVAVRIPAHPLTLKLLELLDFPLAAPSANPSGYVSPTNPNHVQEQLGSKVNYILDGGQCSIGLESTIVSFLGKIPEILRFGGLPLEKIEEVIGKVQVPEAGFSDNPVAPGMLKKHYATRHPMVRGDIRSNLLKYKHNRAAAISFCKGIEDIDQKNMFVLSENASLEEAAMHLFAAMRNADTLDVDVILAEYFPDNGLGRAINDRLNRASVSE
jgi:L-threonylcarbamoyladenylate synthase